jgi:cytosine/adenosine deaminase-related metal-dependent hydrolase
MFEEEPYVSENIGPQVGEYSPVMRHLTPELNHAVTTDNDWWLRNLDALQERHNSAMLAAYEKAPVSQD